MISGGSAVGGVADGRDSGAAGGESGLDAEAAELEKGDEVGDGVAFGDAVGPGGGEVGLLTGGDDDGDEGCASRRAARITSTTGAPAPGLNRESMDVAEVKEARIARIETRMNRDILETGDTGVL